MPFAEEQGRLRRDDDRQRGDRAAVAQAADQEARVVLVLVRPAESNDTPGEIREPALEMAVDRFTMARERVGRQGDPRVEQALSRSLRRQDLSSPGVMASARATHAWSGKGLCYSSCVA